MTDLYTAYRATLISTPLVSEAALFSRVGTIRVVLTFLDFTGGNRASYFFRK